MLRDERTAQVKNVRAYLDKVYNTTGSGARIDELTDDEVMEMAQNLKNGVPFATPVFDGATERNHDDARAGLSGRRRQAHAADPVAHAGLAVRRPHRRNSSAR